MMRAEEASAAIRDMKVRGAAEIARIGAEAMKEEAIAFKGTDLAQFRAHMDSLRERLLESRPTAVSLWNAAAYVLRNTGSASSVDEMRELIVRNAYEFVSRSKEAVETIGRFGAGRLRDGDKVLTHCNSKAALAAIVHAHKEGKGLDVCLPLGT
jgi:ribose 1,5-bisphosphate isomerase